MTRTRNGRAETTLVVLSFVALVAVPAAGQTVEDQRVWTAVSLHGRVGADSPWRWASDVLVRGRDGADTLDFLAEQIMVTRDLTERSSAGIGYAFGAVFLDAGSLREHQFVQQYVWSAGADWRVSLRSRLEEHLVPGHEALLFRVRQQVRVTWPLGARGGLTGVASEELFVQANSTTRAPRGFDSNQVFVGIGRTLTARSGVEVGYINVYARGGANRNRRSHVISATLVVSL